MAPTHLRRILVSTALAAFVAAPAHGADLLRMLDAARLHDPALRAAQAGYRAALARVPQARSALLPQVQAAASVSDNTQRNSENPLLQRFGFATDWDYSARDVSLTATQALYQPAAHIATQQADNAARIAYVRLQQQDQGVMLQLAAAYFERLAAQDALDSLLTQQRATLRQLASAQRNFAAGNGTALDTRDAQARADLLAAQIIAARNRVALADSSLQDITGLPPGPVAPLQAGLRPPVPDGTLDHWTRAAERQAPAVQQARLELDNARLQARIADAGHGPTVDAFARLDRASTSGGSNLFPFGTRAELASIGVQARWPLYTGHRVESQQDEAAALLDQAQANLDGATLAASHAARDALLTLRSDVARLDALNTALASANASVDANRLGWTVGMRVNLDVLNAQAQAFDIQRQADQARDAVLLDGLRLRFAAGDLGSRDLAAVDALLRR